MRATLSLFVAAAVVAAAIAVVQLNEATITHHGTNTRLTPQDLANWMADGGEKWTGEETLPEMRQKLLRRVLTWAEETLGAAEMHPFATEFFGANLEVGAEKPSLEEVREALHSIIHEDEISKFEIGPDGQFAPLGGNPYPYFAFLPEIQGHAVPGGDAVSWETDCWGTNTLTAAEPAADGTIAVKLTVDNQKSFLCSDTYLVATVESVKLGFDVGAKGDHTLTWNVTGISSAENYDVMTRGVRFFILPGGTLAQIGNIINTALLFTPLLSQGVSASAAARNMDFLSKYADVHMQNRTTNEVDIDESTIQSGDFFGIIRLDGLDPMLGWAMGSTTGHTTVALRENGTLFIAESTANDSYWPVNGIQRTPYKQWIAQAKAAGFQVVHAPLGAKAAANFDEDKANAWFKTVEGFNYGYHNMLLGWIDTVNDNYPCVAPNFTQCLSWDTVTVLFGLVDKVAPAAADLIFNAAMNQRLGTTGLGMAEVLQEADKKGIPANTLPVIVEQDSWVYNTTRYGKPAMGPSMVCCVFVCHTWKAAGVFGDLADEINCVEQTNYDDYVRNFLDAPTRPAQCKAADPDNQLCQLLGDYTLELNDYATLAPYAHMDEKCPSEAPTYKRPSGC